MGKLPIKYSKSDELEAPNGFHHNLKLLTSKTEDKFLSAIAIPNCTWLVAVL